MEIINTNFVSNIMDIEIHQIKIAKYVGCRIILYGPSLHTIWLLSNCTRDVDSRKVFTIIAFKDIIVTGICKIIPITKIIPGLSALFISNPATRYIIKKVNSQYIVNIILSHLGESVLIFPLSANVSLFTLCII